MNESNKLINSVSSKFLSVGLFLLLPDWHNPSYRLVCHSPGEPSTEDCDNQGREAQANHWKQQLESDAEKEFYHPILHHGAAEDTRQSVKAIQCDRSSNR